MMKKTQNEIIDLIKKTETLTAVEVIISSEDNNKASVIINDKMFSTPFEIKDGYTVDFLKTIKNTISDDILLILFEDTELPNAWTKAYSSSGIPKERHDRRVIFHSYNDMNEMFCVDRSLLWDITDYFKGTDHELTEDKCKWRYEIVKWYKNHLI